MSAVFSSTMTNVSKDAFGHEPYGVVVAVPTDALLEKYTALFAGLEIIVTKI